MIEKLAVSYCPTRDRTISKDGKGLISPGCLSSLYLRARLEACGKLTFKMAKVRGAGRNATRPWVESWILLRWTKQRIETSLSQLSVSTGGHSILQSHAVPQMVTGQWRVVHRRQENELQLLQPWKPWQVQWPSHEVTEAVDATGSRTVNRTHTHLRMGYEPELKTTLLIQTGTTFHTDAGPTSLALA